MFEKESNCSKHNFIAVLALSIVIKINVLQNFKYNTCLCVQSLPTILSNIKGSHTWPLFSSPDLDKHTVN